MIEINLVPVALRKKSTTGVFSFLPLDLPPNCLMGTGAFVALLIAVHILLFVKMGIDAGVMAIHKNEWQKLQPDKNTIDSLGTQLKDFKKREKDIADMTSSKTMGWSRKLNIMSDSLPKGMWLRKMVVDKNAMVLEGSVVSQNQGEVAVVSSFANNLKSDALFMKDFIELEVNSIQKEKRGTAEISNFKVTAKLP